MSRPARRRGLARPRARASELVVALALAGCATPAPEDPRRIEALAGLGAQDRFVAAPADAPAPGPADLRWWTRFDDPALAAWVERALAANLDLALARTRIDEARAALRAAQGARGAQLAAEARVDARSRSTAVGDRRAEPTLTLRLDWDADLWAGLRYGERAAAATLAGRGFEARAVRLSTVALTARAYIGWQEARLDVQAQEEALALWRETARVVRVRVDAGLSPQLDALRADGEVAAAEADVVSAAARVRDAERALQLLAAMRPGGPLGSDSAPRLPVAPGVATGAGEHSAAALPVVLPLDLLRLRPDLRAAEHALRAAEADLGAAAAAERPSLRLPGVLTLGTSTGGTLLASLTAAVAAELTMQLVDGGQRAAATDAARARLQAAEIVYRQTLQQALDQTEAAFVAHAAALRVLAAQAEAVRAADAAVQQARTLYDNGLAGFLDLLQAQRSALARRQARRSQEADLVRSAVATYEAMGLLSVAPADDMAG